MSKQRITSVKHNADGSIEITGSFDADSLRSLLEMADDGEFGTPTAHQCIDCEQLLDDEGRCIDWDCDMYLAIQVESQEFPFEGEQDV